MDINEIHDVLNVSRILSGYGYADAAHTHTPSLIADLIDWSDSRHEHVHVNPVAAVAELGETIAKTEPKPKRGKATESKDSDNKDWDSEPEPSPDPSTDDEPGF